MLKAPSEVMPFDGIVVQVVFKRGKGEPGGRAPGMFKADSVCQEKAAKSPGARRGNGPQREKKEVFIREGRNIFELCADKIAAGLNVPFGFGQGAVKRGGKVREVVARRSHNSRASRVHTTEKRLDLSGKKGMGGVKGGRVPRDGENGDSREWRPILNPGKGERAMGGTDLYQEGGGGGSHNRQIVFGRRQTIGGQRNWKGG